MFTGIVEELGEVTSLIDGGGDSAVIALALPFTTDFGTPFPARALIIFFTFEVIFVTLVLQGLTLPLGTPEAFGKHVEAETKRWGEVIRKGNIKAE